MVPTRAVMTPAGLGQPLYGASAGMSVRRFWRKYATFTGRASRAEYWWVWLVNGLIAAAILVVTLLIESVITRQSWMHLFEAPAPIEDALQSLWLAATLVPTIAVSMRRLHDTNRSGWWCLLFLPVLASNAWSIIGDLSTWRPHLGTGLSVTGQIVFVAVSILGFIFLVSGPKPEGQRFDQPSLQSVQQT